MVKQDYERNKPIKCNFELQGVLKMKKIITVLMVLLLASAFVFANGQQEAAGTNAAESGFSGDLAMGGSTTVAPIIDIALEAFKKDQPSVNATYASVGSSNGIQGVVDGVYMVGGSSKSREKNEEKGVYATQICIDGIATVVSSNVAVDDLTREQINAIYAGEITNWKDLGGDDAEIVVLSRDEASGTYDSWQSFTVKAAGKKFVEGMIVVVSNGDLASKLASTPNAIGYVGAGFIDDIGDAKVLTVDGIEANKENIMSFDYPYARYLYVVTPAAPAAGTIEEYFINWLLTSREGKKSVADAGYHPL